MGVFPFGSVRNLFYAPTSGWACHVEALLFCISCIASPPGPWSKEIIGANKQEQKKELVSNRLHFYAISAVAMSRLPRNRMLTAASSRLGGLDVYFVLMAACGHQIEL